MRIISRLGAFNFALGSAHLAPAWAADALRALTSPYGGLENRAHAAVVTSLLRWCDAGFEGLMSASQVVGAVKLVIAAAVIAYLIDYGRSVATGTHLDRQTQHAAFALAMLGALLWALPMLTGAGLGWTPLHAAPLILVAGAALVAAVEQPG